MNIEAILAFLSLFVLTLTSILALIWKDSEEGREIHRKNKERVDFLTALILFKEFNGKKLREDVESIKRSSLLRKIILFLMAIIFPVLFGLGVFSHIVGL